MSTSEELLVVTTELATSGMMAEVGASWLMVVGGGWLLVVGGGSLLGMGGGDVAGSVAEELGSDVRMGEEDSTADDGMRGEDVMEEGTGEGSMQGPFTSVTKIESRLSKLTLVETLLTSIWAT